jgi:hypothetical protein
MTTAVQSAAAGRLRALYDAMQNRTAQQWAAAAVLSAVSWFPIVALTETGAWAAMGEYGMPGQVALAAGADRLDLFAPDAVFLNPAARLALGDPQQVQLQSGLQWHGLRVAGTVQAPGAPLLVMDVAAAQTLLQRPGALSRIDLRLAPGAQADAVLQALALPATVLAQGPENSSQRASLLSRAYRVNLTVLALVALFTGGFLVFSVLSLSVTRRQQQFALLGVLGLADSFPVAACYIREQGALAVFFCSAAANNVRGVAWNMDGGWAAQ